MKVNIPKDLATLSKDELIKLVHTLIAKLDNCIVEEERGKELKSSCHCEGCAKPRCGGCKCK